MHSCASRSRLRVRPAALVFAPRPARPLPTPDRLLHFLLPTPVQRRPLPSRPQLYLVPRTPLSPRRCPEPGQRPPPAAVRSPRSPGRAVGKAPSGRERLPTAAATDRASVPAPTCQPLNRAGAKAHSTRYVRVLRTLANLDSGPASDWPCACRSSLTGWAGRRDVMRTTFGFQPGEGAGPGGWLPAGGAAGRGRDCRQLPLGAGRGFLEALQAPPAGVGGGQDRKSGLSTATEENIVVKQGNCG